MEKPQPPAHLLIIDIDGFRQDAFHAVLRSGGAPQLAALLGGAEAGWGIHLDPASTAPSITFCAQSSIFTGALPREHQIAGNQFFDRLSPTPRFYAFDAGDTFEVGDAMAVFTGSGLLADTVSPATPTLYETAAQYGFEATVAHHMLPRGARTWLPPTVFETARFIKSTSILGISSEDFDNRMVTRIREHLEEGNRPQILTAYFLGLDHESHQHGPSIQPAYVARSVDPLIGRLVELLKRHELFFGQTHQADTLVVIVSDHGQIDVPAQDRHAIQLGFLHERELAALFDSLGLDVHDLPGEDGATQAVVGSNGGLAHISLRGLGRTWQQPPRYHEDVDRLAQALWQANEDGARAPDLRGALSAVLVRNVERDGWLAPYQAWTPNGLLPVERYLADHPEILTVDAAARLNGLAGYTSGDLLLLSNYAGGFYFSSPVEGNHGGLHPDDSLTVLSFGWPGASPAQVEWLRRTAQEISGSTRRAEGRSYAALTDMVPVLRELFGWK